MSGNLLGVTPWIPSKVPSFFYRSFFQISSNKWLSSSRIFKIFLSRTSVDVFRRFLAGIFSRFPSRKSKWISLRNPVGIISNPWCFFAGIPYYFTNRLKISLRFSQLFLELVLYYFVNVLSGISPVRRHMKKIRSTWKFDNNRNSDTLRHT